MQHSVVYTGELETVVAKQFSPIRRRHSSVAWDLHQRVPNATRIPDVRTGPWSRHATSQPHHPTTNVLSSLNER